MAKKIFSVGFNLPGDFAENISLASNRSLLDADIILFRPSFEELSLHYSFDGQELFDSSSDRRCRSAIQHWNHELFQAFNVGKTIVIFLSAFEHRMYSTSESVHNYNLIPVKCSYTPVMGKEMQAVGDHKLLANYWREYASSSVYHVYIENSELTPTFMTTTGQKVVGAMQTSSGTMILLPSLEYDEDNFYTDNEEEGEPIWTKEGIDFGRRLSSCFIEIDKVLRSGRVSTPLPEWAQQPTYRLSEEATIEKRIKAISQQIETLHAERETLRNNLEQAGSLRRLLYETGHPLEEAIIEALHLLGFQAENYKEGASEFDAVFTSDEGRFLGEAEGKDSKAINTDKLDQLERNLREDFSREDVTEYAKGVLFGNACRLLPPQDRTEFFTAKCLSGAKRSGVALIRTPDLFAAARYLKEQKDEDFAKRCREALRDAEGSIVQFPPVPSVVTEAGVAEVDAVTPAVIPPV